ncbi:MAG: FAD-dependent oxidoreductase [Cyanobium sp.]
MGGGCSASGHAVILGGGVAGLLAARVLADQFDHVTVLERASLPCHAGQGAPRPRPGVPQGRCLHLLMAPGARMFDRLLPGWRQELVGMGAIPFDAVRDVLLPPLPFRAPALPSGDLLYGCSRGLLEAMLRNLVLRRGAITLRDGCEVRGLVADDQGRQVKGVVVAHVRGKRLERVPADLVVDAGGASSFLPRWLAASGPIGAGHLPVTLVRGRMTYLARWYALSASLQPPWCCLSIAPSAATGGRAAMLLRVEHGHWGLVLLAPSDHPLPTDDSGLLMFSHGLADGGRLTAMLCQARPASPVHHFGASGSHWRHYEMWRPWPAGLVALGDSVCALDPYYGLGMSLAADAACTLQTSLPDRRQAGWEGSFQRRLASQVGRIWARVIEGRDCHRLPKGDEPSITAFATWAMQDAPDPEPAGDQGRACARPRRRRSLTSLGPVD